MKAKILPLKVTAASKRIEEALDSRGSPFNLNVDIPVKPKVIPVSGTYQATGRIW
jgi:hypothetical protein